MRRNYQIKASQVRLINSDGTHVGVVTFQEALNQAKDQNLDLLEINAKSFPITCRIADYGKWQYEEKKKAVAARKSQKQTELKELTFRPSTDEHDLNHKLELAKEFLADGNKVKFSVRFRGREITHPEIGRDKINWLIKQLTDLIVATPPLSTEGKIMSVIVSPK